VANIIGTSGNDTLSGTAEDDLIEAAAGDDFIDGGAGNDSINGGDGDDDIFGGAGNDTIDGGAGNDIITGGAGNDLLRGGAGNDQFYGLNVGDTVDGGEDGDEDFDRLFLNGLVPDGGRYEINSSEQSAENGTIDIFGADDAYLGAVTFKNIEKIDPFDNTPPCFTPGTLIVTAKGECRVEDLAVGDRVITRDNGMQKIRWIGKRDMHAAELARASHLRPILIRQGALGNDLPERDLTVSPNHRVLIANDKTALYFDDREVLVAAKHLTGMEGVEVSDVAETTYIHIMFDHHEVILSDGAWTESFQPGDESLASIGDAQKAEIFELFPELQSPSGVGAYGAARRSLKKHEAVLLTS